MYDKYNDHTTNNERCLLWAVPSTLQPHIQKKDDDDDDDYDYDDGDDDDDGGGGGGGGGVGGGGGDGYAVIVLYYLLVTNFFLFFEMFSCSLFVSPSTLISSVQRFRREGPPVAVVHQQVDDDGDDKQSL